MSKSRDELDSITEQLEDSLCKQESNKPDFRELDLGSPVSPLRNARALGTSTVTQNTATTTTTTTSYSSSSSGGSVSGSGLVANGGIHLPKSAGHSGELCTSAETSPSLGGKCLIASGQGTTVGQSRSEPQLYSGSVCGNSGAGGGGTQSSATSLLTPNVLPSGNICPSGRVVKTGMASRSCKTDVLGSGMGNYGHGSIMRGGSGGATGHSASAVTSNRTNATGGFTVASVACRQGPMDPEDLKKLGNEMYKKGHYREALGYYEKAIGISPGNAAYRSNRAAALIGLGRVGEAVKECEEALRLDPSYFRAHQRLGSLFLRLGLIENARRHLCIPGNPTDPSEIQKLQTIEKHINKSIESRKVNDWKTVLKESEAAIAAGADFSPNLIICKAEAFINLHQLENAETCLLHCPVIEPYNNSSEAHSYMVRAQIDLAQGKFEQAISLAEKAGQIDPQNPEIGTLLNKVRLVGRARNRGNDLFNSDRFTEACSAYGEGLKIDPSNSVLYCNRAACWSKLGNWEKSVCDCNSALQIHPNYTKALLRRAASYIKLERWTDAVRDYEVLRKQLPDDNEISEALFHAQIALKKSRGEKVNNLTFGGEVEQVKSIEQFKSALSLPGISVVQFKNSSNLQCKQISSFVDLLCGRYPSINFLKVDTEQTPGVANAENVRIVPTFKIYKNGNRVKEIVCPSFDLLEHSIRHYSL